MLLASVSVLMPCFNPGPFLREAVASVLAHSQCLELLVADGGSTDGSLALLYKLASQDSRIRITCGPDQGPADALNKAFAQARGTLIGWLNADDLYPPGALGRAAEALVANPEWLMVYGEGEEFNTATGQRHLYPTLHPRVGLNGFHSHCFICQPTVVFRRTMGLLLGPFDLQWRTAFDFDYWLRAFSAFPDRIGYIPSLQGLTRLHENTITSRNRAQVALEATSLLARHFGAASANRLHSYAQEVQLGLAQLPVDCSLAESLETVVSSAKSCLAAVEVRQFRHDWLLDTSTSSAQIGAEHAVMVNNLFARATAGLLQIVHPHLRVGHPGPPAGPHLRLQAALDQGPIRYPLLLQERPLQRFIHRLAHGETLTRHPFGLNIIQLAHGGFEIDLWLQSLIAVFSAAGIPFFRCYPSDDPGPYAINLITLPPSGHAQWLLERGLKPQLGRLSIAAWPSIPSGWPLAWHPLLALVDEVWAPSSGVFQAISSFCSRPLWMIPTLPSPAYTRAPHPLIVEDSPSVLLYVDLQASSHLYNSFGAVEVFRRSFPASKPCSASERLQNAQLLILVEHADPSDCQWQWLQASCSHDSRIRLCVLDGLSLKQRSEILSSGEVLLSLQRSYAVSSLLATAQAFGLQVLATAFGASLDLQASSNLRLVPVRQVPIPRDACADSESFLWGEPDPDVALLELQRAVAMPPPLEQFNREVELAYSSQVLRDRLLQLWKKHRGD